MKKAARALAFFACLLSLMLIVVPALAAGSGGYDANVVPGQLLVQMKPGSDPGTLCKAMGMRVKRALNMQDAYLLEADPKAGAMALASALQSRADVECASPNYICHAYATPNDSGYTNQWGMESIRMPAAWDIQKGKSSVTVAVIDSGISRSHADLRSRLVPGYDFVNDDADPNDDFGHGTHVAGIIAASTNNGIGVAGVCWEGVKLMPIKVLGEDGTGPADAMIDGIAYAVDHGAKVINMSLGMGTDPGTIFRKAISDAAAKGVVLVAAAGNSSDIAAGVRAPVGYPAAYSEVIAVSAIDRKDRIANYSCVGSEIDIAAPGGAGTGVEKDDIYSTYRSGGMDGYAYMPGTSMAAPHVAGVCALLLSAGAKASDVLDIIKSTARKVDPDKQQLTFPNQDYGYGVLDASAALQAISLYAALDKPVTNTTYVTHNLTPTIRGSLIYADFNTAQLYIDNVLVASVANGLLPMPEVGATEYRFSYQADLALGNHVIKLAAQNAKGNTKEAIGQINVTPYRIESGTRMFSVPYALDEDNREPEDIFAMIGGNFRLARWIPGDLATYALYNPFGVRDSRASFNPLDGGVSDAPRGLGYWVRILDQSGVDITVRGTMDDLNSYKIALQTGWNLIGDPFDFPVDWNGTLLEYQGQTKKISEAIAAPYKWIQPTLYRYSGQAYTWANPPNGQLMPWEGHWVKANVPCTLIVPPLPSTAALSVGGESR